VFQEIRICEYTALRKCDDNGFAIKSPVPANKLRTVTDEKMTEALRGTPRGTRSTANFGARSYTEVLTY
jgi:hypothetical protein